jgi:hypothetical protein
MVIASLGSAWKPVYYLFSASRVDIFHIIYLQSVDDHINMSIRRFNELSGDDIQQQSETESDAIASIAKSLVDTFASLPVATSGRRIRGASHNSTMDTMANIDKLCQMMGKDA